MSTLKATSTVTGGTSAGDTAPLMKITFGVGVLASQSALQITDSMSAPIFAVTQTGAFTFGDFYGTYNTTAGRKFQFNSSTSGSSANTNNPASLYLQIGATYGFGWALRVGTDAPQRVISVSSSDTSLDTLTSTAHGLPATVTPVVFTACSFTSTPSIALGTSVYYVKQVTDANTLKVYTNSSLTALVDITSNSTATFYIKNVGGEVNMNDLYRRLDDPTTSGHRIYQAKTYGAGGTAATWDGVF